MWRRFFIVLADGFLGFVITAGTSALAVVADRNPEQLSDISDVAWFVVVVGALIGSAKTIQSRLAPNSKDTS